MWGKQSGRTNVLATIGIIIVLCIIGFLVWWFGFNNSGNNNNTAKTNQPTAQATKNTIKDNWEAFFNGQTSASRKVALLQNGQQFSQFITAESKQQTAKATAASVSNVQLNGNNTATVTYTVFINKQPVLKDQKNQAVYVNGAWKVSDGAFCSLLALGNAAPPNCPGGGSSGSSSGSASGATSGSGSSSSTSGSSSQTQTSPSSTPSANPKASQ